MRKVLERVINLLVMLLTASRPVPADEIRRTIPGYSADSDEAFHRMFERDKDLLRRIGIPIELRPMDGWEVDHGYLVDPNAYRLADPGLTDEERAALLLAAQMVRLGGELAAPEAVLKLGGARTTGAVEPLSADLGLGAETLGELFKAVTERRLVSFRYRSTARRMAPYGLGHRRGHWYLVGGTNEGQRTYRVDRMEQIEVEAETGTFRRPEDFDLKGVLDHLAWEGGPGASTQAMVRFSPEVAWWASRQLGSTARQTDAAGSITVTVAVSNPAAFLGWVLTFGEGAEVLSPPQLRQAVIDRVKGVA
ncbi:MAG: helix-turn-helix transcriptional regulator [Acidimicrobiia bacterium]